jgi:hypothetical protein
MAFLFLPLVGAYIGFLQVIKDNNNPWRDDNPSAYILRNGK